MTYKDLEIEVSRVWRVRTEILPVVQGALATIRKGSEKNIQLLPGHPSAVQRQKVTLTNEHRTQHL